MTTLATNLPSPSLKAITQTSDVEWAFHLALQHHAAGRLAEAEALYRQVLAAQRDHVDALHFLGVLAHQVGRNDVALELIRQSIALRPNQPIAYSHLGEVYRALGHLNEAVAACREALRLEPNYPGAYNNLGAALHKCGRYDEAIAALKQAVYLKPDCVEAYCNLGAVLQDKGELSEAATALREVLRLKPDHAEAHADLGGVLAELGCFEEAIASYQRALQLKPDNPGTYNNLGNALRMRGATGAAIAAYRQAIALKEDFAEAHNNLGCALLDQGCNEEATAAFRRAIELKPGYAEAYNNLGIVFHKCGRFDDAIVSLHQALHWQPDHANAQNNLGAVLKAKGDLERAAVALRRALEINPEHVDACNNLGTVLREQRHIEAAIGVYRRALQLKPDNAETELNLAMLLLLSGDFEHGWPLYESRWSYALSGKRKFAQPQWDGCDLGGKRVLVYAEQGAGDAIQFIRYAPFIAMRGGEVVVECPASLVKLFRNVKGVSEVWAAGGELPEFDVHIPMLSLPLLFQTSVESIPAEVPYLTADFDDSGVWAKRIGARQGRLKVGLAWAGNPEHRETRKRDIPFAELLPLLGVAGVDFFSLQVGPGSEETRTAGGHVIADYTSELKDFAETAALMVHLDLIISVDTAAAHLAGALGRPVWTLLPFVPEWRWGAEGDQSRWYPTMRLFRQPARDDWNSVIVNVVSALEKLSASSP